MTWKPAPSDAAKRMPQGADRWVREEWGRPVTDETELTGYYNYALRWTPDQPPQPRPGDLVPVIDPNGPSLFTAIEEQLGLRLRPARGPVEVLVIDSVQQPTPN